MKKPEPITETKQPIDFIQMKNWINKKYSIDTRDYAGKFRNCPSFVDILVEQGINKERAEQLYKTAPAEITDEQEKQAYAVAQKTIQDHLDKTPYQDFWHYQLTLFHNFSNDSYQTLNLKYQLEDCEEDWQREIAQLWLDEFGEYMDEEGDVFLWVSW